MWKLKQIFDGEYGCEERQPGEKEKCLVILANEEGEEKTFAYMRKYMVGRKNYPKIK